MRLAFPAALHPFEHEMHHVPAAVDEKDRHVVAVALASGSDVIVTDNLRHFAITELAAMGVAVQSAEAFLIEHVALTPSTFGAVLEEQGAELQPPRSRCELIEAFARLPVFADQAHQAFCGDACERRMLLSK